MTIYFCLYALIGLTVLLTTIKCEKVETKNKICCWVIFSLVFLIVGLRHETMGVDLLKGSDYLGYTGYLQSYDKIGRCSWLEIIKMDSFLNYEKGFIVFNKLIHVLSWGSRQVFLIVCAALSLFPLAYVFYKKSASPALSFVIYLGLPVFLLVFSGLRQAIAIGICAFALLFIQKRKPIPFVLMVLLATQFHSSAWLFLIAYPAYFIKLNFPLRITTAFLIPVVFLLRRPLFSILSLLLKENAVADDNNSITLLIVFFAIYFFCLIFMDDSEEQNGYLNLFFLACICQTFAGVYNTAMRVGYYFMIALSLLLPLSVRNTKSMKDGKLVTLIITVCFVAFALFSLAKDSFAVTNPYHFFWEQVT